MVIMSSSRALRYMPSVKKQEHDFHFFFFVQSIMKQSLDSEISQIPHSIIVSNIKQAVKVSLIKRISFPYLQIQLDKKYSFISSSAKQIMVQISLGM